MTSYFARVLIFSSMAVFMSAECRAQSKNVQDFMDKFARHDPVTFQQEWTIDKLASNADLVVIFEPTQEWQDEPEASIPRDVASHKGSLRTICCRLNVISILKSPKDLRDDSQIILRMVTWRREWRGYASRPILASWLDDSGSTYHGLGNGKSGPVLLGFLKRTGDHVYEPVGGHYFAAFSFVEIVGANLRPKDKIDVKEKTGDRRDGADGKQK